MRVIGLAKARNWFKKYPEGGAYFQLYVGDTAPDIQVFIRRYECDERSIKAKVVEAVKGTILEGRCMKPHIEIRYVG